MVRHVKRVVPVIALLSLAAIASQSALGDILITTSGKQWKGTITEKSDHYVLTTSKGSRLSFPKAMVKEVVTAEKARARLAELAKSTDFSDDVQLESLLVFAAEWDIESEREGLLASAYEKRISSAEGKVDRLRSILEWCKKHKLSRQGWDCVTRLCRAEFPSHLEAAGHNARALAELAQWAREHGLREPWLQTEGKALELGGEDPLVRERLGYAKDESGKWSPVAVEPEGFMVAGRVVTFSLPTYGEHHIAPNDPGQRLLVIQAMVPWARVVPVKLRTPIEDAEDWNRRKRTRGCLAWRFRVLLGNGQEAEGVQMAFLTPKLGKHMPMYGANPLEVDPRIEKQQPFTRVAVVFVVDGGLCKPPLKLRFDVDDPVPVPANQIQIAGCEVN